MTITPTLELAAKTANTLDGGPTGNNQTQSQIITMADGRFVIFWTDTSNADSTPNAGTDIFAQVYDVSGVAIGAAGVPALLDLRGTHDLFDYPLQITQVGLADELAAAASLLMGQAAEGRPVIHARGVPYPLREGDAQELIRQKELDMFR